MVHMLVPGTVVRTSRLGRLEVVGFPCSTVDPHRLDGRGHVERRRLDVSVPALRPKAGSIATGFVRVRLEQVVTQKTLSMESKAGAASSHVHPENHPFSPRSSTESGLPRKAGGVRGERVPNRGNEFVARDPSGNASGKSEELAGLFSSVPCCDPRSALHRTCKFAKLVPEWRV